MALITQTSPLIGSARDKGGSVSSDLMFLQAGVRCKLRVFLSRFRSPYNHVHTPSLYSAACSLHSSNLGTSVNDVAISAVFSLGAAQRWEGFIVTVIKVVTSRSEIHLG